MGRRHAQARTKQATRCSAQRAARFAEEEVGLPSALCGSTTLNVQIARAALRGTLRVSDRPENTKDEYGQ